MVFDNNNTNSLKKLLIFANMPIIIGIIYNLNYDNKGQSI